MTWIVIHRYTDTGEWSIVGGFPDRPQLTDPGEYKLYNTDEPYGESVITDPVAAVGGMFTDYSRKIRTILGLPPMTPDEEAVWVPVAITVIMNPSDFEIPVHLTPPPTDSTPPTPTPTPPTPIDPPPTGGTP
jgi:hypothetical protein